MRDLSSWTSSERKLQSQSLSPWQMPNKQLFLICTHKVCLYLSCKFLCKTEAEQQKLPLATFPSCPCWRAQSMLERSCPAPLGVFDKNPFLAHGPKWYQK